MTVVHQRICRLHQFFVPVFGFEVATAWYLSTLIFPSEHGAPSSSYRGRRRRRGHPHRWHGHGSDRPTVGLQQRRCGGREHRRCSTGVCGERSGWEYLRQVDSLGYGCTYALRKSFTYVKPPTT